MPFAVADSLAARGLAPVIFALKGACDPVRVARFRHHWISVGQIGKATRLFRSEGCRDLMFIGSAGAAGAVGDPARLGHAARHRPMSWRRFAAATIICCPAIGRILEQDGFRMVGIKDVAPDLLMPEGCITRAAPDGNAAADIAQGTRSAAARSVRSTSARPRS